MIRVLVVDDHAGIRTAVKTLLARTEDIRVIGEAHTAQLAIDMAQTVQPDVVLLDLNMLPVDGIQACRQIVSKLPHVTVIGFSEFPYKYQEEQMIAAGAAGVVKKNLPVQDLIEKIKFFHRVSGNHLS